MQYAKKTHKPAKNQDDVPTPVVATGGKSEAEMFTEIEWLLKSSVKASSEGLYSTMAQLIIEEAPQNGKELYDSIGKHIKDAPDSFNRQMKKLFTDLFKAMDAKKLIGAKIVKKVEEKKVSSDDENTSKAATEVETNSQTTNSEQNTPVVNKESSEVDNSEPREEEPVLTEW